MADEADDILDALGVEVAPIKQGTHTPQEERIIAGFEEILRFVEQQGHAPDHGEQKEIFERLYAVRLDRLREIPAAVALLSPLDTHGLLKGGSPKSGASFDDLDPDALLDQLGAGETASDDITVLRHVRSFEDKRAAEEIERRTKCEDFEKFAPLFQEVERELKNGVLKMQPLKERKQDEIQQGTFFVVGGQIAYIAETKEEFTTKYDRKDFRLRVIYDNGTESEVLMRSLQRALYRDEKARLIAKPDMGPLFGDVMDADDLESGTIYVLQSLSDNPYVAQHRELIHKIGVTGGKVETRIADAENQATYMLAAVKVVATYKLSNLNRTKVENLIHRIFAPALLDMTINDRFGKPVKPREWFLVPLQAIDEAVERFRDGSITEYVYDPKQAMLVKAKQ